MVAKILAALAIPVIVVVVVGEILRVTHHTAIPPMSISVTPAAHSSVTRHRVTPGELHACAGKLRRHFSGIAVKHSPAAKVAAYSKAFSRKPQIVEFYNAFGQPFRAGEAWKAVLGGQIPFIQLNPRHVSLAQVVSGAENAQIMDYATAVKAFPCKVILSFGHEMNGWWYPWGRPTASPSQFIRAWRHIHDIFAKAGVTNVIWSWDPSHQYGHFAPRKTATAASKWYPGNAYVNWIGLDGYLGYSGSGQAQDFEQIFGYQLQNVRNNTHGKPVYIAETGVAPGPALARQIAELFAGAEAHHLMGIVWFDAVAKNDYRLVGHKIMDAAYLKGITSFLKK